MYTRFLSATAALGCVWLFLLFLLCFLGVHGIRLAKLRKSRVGNPPKQPDKSETETKEKAPAAQEPIYYIVEKKRTRQKAKYGEPKEIRFK